MIRLRSHDWVNPKITKSHRAKGKNMTKAELYSVTTAAVIAYAEAQGFDVETIDGLKNILEDNLAPKSGGAAVNLDEVTRKDEDGNIVELQCATSKVFLPATLEFFYEDKSENPKIVNAQGEPLKRLSRQAEAVGKRFIKTQRATIQAITDDILEAEDMEKIEELKVQLVAAKTAKPDYSTVSPVLSEDD